MIHAITTLHAATTTIALVLLATPIPTKALTSAVAACLAVETTMVVAILVAHALEVAIHQAAVIQVVVVATLAAIAEVAHAKEAALLVDVDNSFTETGGWASLPPLRLSPLPLLYTKLTHSCFPRDRVNNKQIL